MMTKVGGARKEGTARSGRSLGFPLLFLFSSAVCGEGGEGRGPGKYLHSPKNISPSLLPQGGRSQWPFPPLPRKKRTVKKVPPKSACHRGVAAKMEKKVGEKGLQIAFRCFFSCGRKKSDHAQWSEDFFCGRMQAWITVLVNVLHRYSFLFSDPLFPFPSLSHTLAFCVIDSKRVRRKSPTLHMTSLTAEKKIYTSVKPTLSISSL